MALQNQPFKNCKNEFQHAKVNFISPLKYNQQKTEITASIYKMGSPNVKLSLISWVFIIPFNFGYDHIMKFTY